MAATELTQSLLTSLEPELREKIADDQDWAAAGARLRNLTLTLGADGAVNVATGDPDLQRHLADNMLPRLRQIILSRLNHSAPVPIRYPAAAETAPLAPTASPPAPWPSHHRLEDYWPVGPAGRMAVRSLTDAAGPMGSHYNPILLTGTYGLGKTHLLQGFLAALRANRPEASHLACTGAEFAQLFQYHQARRTVDVFHAHLCQIDCLIIDDLHGLAQDPANRETQDALLRICERRYAAQRQMVFSALSDEKDQIELSPRLASRLRHGVIIALTPLDEASRLSLLRIYGHQAGLSLPAAALDYFSRCHYRTVPEIKSLLRQLAAAAREPDGLNGSLTLERARALAGIAAPAHDAPSPSKTAPAMPDIEEYFAAQARLTPEQLRSGNRSRHIAFPRQMAMFCTHRYTRASMEAIGQYYGGRDHSTVKHACEKIAQMIENDENAAQLHASFRSYFFGA